MEENKIKNTASVEIELCDEIHTIESNQVEADVVNIRVEKEQSCGKVFVGGKIKYTVKIISECGEVTDLLFKDVFDECTKYVEGSFEINGDKETPDIDDNVLTFKIDKIESCDTITITFEVEVTDECCHCQRPDPERSRQPVTRSTISRFERVITGTGIRGATISVKFPDGEIRDTTVNFLGAWTVFVPGNLFAGDVITVVQIEPNKQPSDPISVTVI